jgi:hypothetical protein
MSEILAKVSFILLFLVSALTSSMGQSILVKGNLNGDLPQTPIFRGEVQLLGTGLSTLSDIDGNFSFVVPIADSYTFKMVYTIYQEKLITIAHGSLLEEGILDLGTVELIRSARSDEGADAIPIVSLEDGDEGEGNQDISSILSASRDLYLSTAAFTFSPARFRIRGFDRRYGSLILNGVEVADPESGFIGFGTWGGLNDVVRKSVSQIGLQANDVTFGNIETTAIIDSRAGSQRPGTNVSFAVSNRTYRQRVMATYASGWNKKGWAFAVSGSRRWAQEGYIEGTFYEGNSLYLGIDKRINNHRFSLTAFAAPLERGQANGAVQESYDLAGSNYYNSNWGFQEGKKRNARVRRTNEPLVTLNHEFFKTNKFSWNNVLSFQKGIFSTTALNWYNTRDPRPDYYRYLPSAIQNPEMAELVADRMRADANLRQIDWARLYNANRNNFVSIDNVLGIEGNTLEGLRSIYIIEDRVTERAQANFNSYFTYFLENNSKITGGLRAQHYKSDNYSRVEDLLGGDFFLDINQFVERDRPDLGETGVQSNLNTPNRLAVEGDKIGYNYENHVRFGELWLQGEWKYRKFDFFASAKASMTSFWRVGLFRSGAFPDDSEGKSEESNFVNYGLKGGLTYKLDGRNYLYFNSGYITNAPSVRNSFLSPRTRNQLAPSLQSETVFNNELSYVLRTPEAKMKVSAYYTTIRDQISTRSFFLDQIEGTTGAFVNYNMTGIDQQFLGLEFSGELRITQELSAFGVANIGEYIYTSRPEATVTLDAVGITNEPKTIYIKNYYVEGTPQTALSCGLRYNSRKFWFANLSVNYFDRAYIPMNFDRRTETAVAGLTTENEELIQAIVGQEKMPSAITVDLFGGKSWRVKRDVYLNLNIGVNNILNNTQFITGGFEQFRFDYNGVNTNVDRFPTRYFYGFGPNYFVNLGLRF